MPMQHIVLRQLRVREEACQLDALLNTFSDYTVNHLPENCARRYHRDVASTDPYPQGRNVTWLPNEQRESWLRSIRMHGDLGSYSDADKVFSIEIPFSATREAVNDTVTDMIENHWIDHQTRVISFELMIFSPAIQTYAMSQFVMEITEIGYVTTMASTRSLHFKHWQFESGWSWVAVILDVFIAAGMVHALLHLCLMWWKKHQAGKRNVNVLEMLVVFSVISFVITYVFRINIWIRANSLKKGRDAWIEDHRAAIDQDYAGNADFYRWDWMVETIDLYNKMWTWFSLATALAAVRLFDYLKYTSRLNVLSNTLKQSYPFLLSLTMIFLLSLLGFAYFGHILWGSHLAEFRTLPHTVGTLLYFLTGEMDHFPEMVAVHNELSTYYVISYMIVAWVILLNLVLAVLAGSFAIVKEARDNPQWSSRYLLHDVQNTLSKVLPCVPRSSLLTINKEGMSSQLARNLLQRIRKEYSKTENAYISANKFLEIGPEMSQAQLAWAFEQTRSQFAGAGREKGLTAGLQHQLDVIRFETTKMGQNMTENVKKSTNTQIQTLEAIDEAWDEVREVHEEVVSARQDLRTLNTNQDKYRKEVKKGAKPGRLDVAKMSTEIEALRTIITLHEHVDYVMGQFKDFNLKLKTVESILSAPEFVTGGEKQTKFRVSDFVSDVAQPMFPHDVEYNPLLDAKTLQKQKRQELVAQAASMEDAITDLQRMLSDLQQQQATDDSILLQSQQQQQNKNLISGNNEHHRHHGYDDDDDGSTCSSLHHDHRDNDDDDDDDDSDSQHLLSLTSSSSRRGQKRNGNSSRHQQQQHQQGVPVRDLVVSDHHPHPHIGGGTSSRSRIPPTTVITPPTLQQNQSQHHHQQHDLYGGLSSSSSHQPTHTAGTATAPTTTDPPIITPPLPLGHQHHHPTTTDSSAKALQQIQAIAGRLTEVEKEIEIERQQLSNHYPPHQQQPWPNNHSHLQQKQSLSSAVRNPPSTTSSTNNTPTADWLQLQQTETNVTTGTKQQQQPTHSAVHIAPLTGTDWPVAGQSAPPPPPPPPHHPPSAFTAKPRTSNSIAEAPALPIQESLRVHTRK
eukprot:TRINITY_DN66145_c1_g1_i1.p1 TRINITY_DN66145_c1_g1~~TRINITY_DN66145_c1_g1_i1.p1  ORF type:complete len:1247 (+),score=121.30 TRINITY_DN66145_c1_g1_i1:520-3741(+)